MSWFQVCIRLTDEASDPDLYASLLLDAGFEGVCIEEKKLIGFIQNTPDQIVHKIHELITDPYEIESLTPIIDQNWTQLCDDLLEPLIIGSITVQPIPTRAEHQSSKKNTIYLIPGMGFGTGHHTTTATIIELLQTHHMTDFHGRILDVGTGSGILAIAAAMLFKEHIDACDTDNVALENAAENIALNDLQNQIQLQHCGIESYQGTYDLIIANIYAEVLIELVHAFNVRLNPAGVLLLSGIMESKRESIREHFTKFKILEERMNNGWCSFLMKKLEEV